MKKNKKPEINNSIQSSIQYSIVVPLKDEAENIEQLDNELRQALEVLTKTNEKTNNYEIIYINDGSKDSTLIKLKEIKQIKINQNNTIIIDLNKNYGQAIALDAGFKQARGEIVISIDGDLQNDPRDIPKLVYFLKKSNFDVVAGWRQHRKDKNSIKIITLIARSFRKILINDKVHDSGCTLRVYKSQAVKSLDLWGEMHRYIVALLIWKGYKISELPVNHRPRISGKTKYSSMKAIKGFIDLLYMWFINKYSQRPLHIFGTFGLFSFFAGFLIEAWMAALKILKNTDLSANAWFVLGFFLMIMGVQFFISGILLDLAMRTHFNASKSEKKYYTRGIY